MFCYMYGGSSWSFWYQLFWYKSKSIWYMSVIWSCLVAKVNQAQYPDKTFSSLHCMHTPAIDWKKCSFWSSTRPKGDDVCLEVTFTGKSDKPYWNNLYPNDLYQNAQTPCRLSGCVYPRLIKFLAVWQRVLQILSLLNFFVVNVSAL